MNDSFQLAIQILDLKNKHLKSENNDKDNNNKENDITNDDDNLLNTSTAKKIINNKQILLSEEKKEEKTKKSLINILLLCEISEINYKSHINFNGIYTKNNSRFLVCKIDNFIKKFKNQKNEYEFSLKIYLSRNYLFPIIIEHICQDFDKYYNLPSINKLPRSAMNILLKNDNINIVNKENYKLYAIENWIKYKNGSISKKYIDIFKNIDWKKIDNDKLIDFFMKNAKLISKEESLKNDIFFEIQRRFQEEYSSYYLNNKTFTNNSKSFSISNFEDIQKNNYLSFTFDFLTKIMSNLISNNNNNERSEYPINDDYSKDIITYAFPVQEERQINFPITQRNNKIPKNKISNNIIINESPSSNEYNKSHLKYKSDLIKKNSNIIINKSKNNKKKNNNNIPTNKHEKKSSNNSLSSYQINLSGFSGIDYLNSGSGNISIFNNKRTETNNQQIDKTIGNSFINKGIKSFTPNNSKGKFIIKNKEIIKANKNNRTLTTKPSRIQFKKSHSKSADKFILLSDDKNIPNNSNIKKHRLFPNYIKYIQNENENANDAQKYTNLNQIKKKYVKENNSSNKIPIQYNKQNSKISLIIYRNNGINSNKNNSFSKSKK